MTLENQAAETAPSIPKVVVSGRPAATAELSAAGFHLVDAGAPGEKKRYLASTDDAAPRCEFQIEIESTETPAGALFSLGKARLHRRDGADCTHFLARVAKEIAFTGKLPRPKAADELICSIAVLGTNQSRTEDPKVGASFSSSPPGNWTAAKLFVADGEGEVFLNLNPRDGVGEFSIKDEDYGRVVVTELARVLLPRAK